MRSSLGVLALAACAFASPEPATEDLSPSGDAPSGCKSTYSGSFEVTVFKSTSKSKRDILESRASESSCSSDGVLVITLEDGVLKDAKNRTGYIASNYQLQFDDPPQDNAKYTSGFSACSNQSLALGSSTVFYQCLSGDFYNLYDRNWAKQCEPVEIIMMSCDSSSTNSKRKVVGSSLVATTIVTVVSAGVTKEVETTIAVPMCQIGDGQVQVRTTPCDDMTLAVITAAPVSQVSNGHIQVPTSKPPTLTTAQATADEANSAETGAGQTAAAAETGTAGTETAAAAGTKTEALVVDTGSPTTVGTAKAKTITTKTSKAKSKSASGTGTETEATSASETEEAAGSTETSSQTSETANPSSSSSRGMALSPGAVFALMVGITWALVSL